MLGQHLPNLGLQGLEHVGRCVLLDGRCFCVVPGRAEHPIVMSKHVGCDCFLVLYCAWPFFGVAIVLVPRSCNPNAHLVLELSILRSYHTTSPSRALNPI
jgi:hypothetical protein